MQNIDSVPTLFAAQQAYLNPPTDTPAPPQQVTRQAFPKSIILLTKQPT